MLFSAFNFVGCGGSSQNVEDETVTDTGTQTQPQDTTTVAAQPDPTVQQQPQPEVQPQPQEATKEEVLQQEIDALKTENIDLKKKYETSEQLNKNQSAKISDLEAALAAKNTKMIAAEPAPVKMSAKKSTPGTSTNANVQAYESAVGLAKERKFNDAIKQLQSLLDGNVRDDYADNCHYWIGESYFQMKQYKNAIEHFKMVANYKFSEKKDDAQLMVAQSYEKIGNASQAKTEYQKLVDEYPTSEYVKRAKSKLR